MNIFKQILDAIYKIFIDNKLPDLIQGGINQDNIKEKFISGIKSTDVLGIDFVQLENTKFIFNYASWESARSTGISDIKIMLNKVRKEVFWFLYKLGVDNFLSEIHISSLWRPNASIHTIGIAVDLGKITSADGETIFLYNNGSSKCPKLIEKISKWSWNSGLINQYIGPWNHRGILGWAKGWFNNGLRYKIEIQHKNHIHITVKVGR